MADVISILGTPNLNGFEIIQTGEITLEKSGSSVSAVTSISHNLGFIPLVLASVLPFTGFSSELVLTPALIIETSGAEAGKIKYLAQVLPNTTSLTFNIFTPNITGGYYSDSFSSVFKYYLLREAAGKLS